MQPEPAMGQEVCRPATSIGEICLALPVIMVWRQPTRYLSPCLIFVFSPIQRKWERAIQENRLTPARFMASLKSLSSVARGKPARNASSR